MKLHAHVVVLMCCAAAFLSGCAAHNMAGETLWEPHMQVGREAFRDGNYSDAEPALIAALKEAEAFGPDDTRSATSLHLLVPRQNLIGRLNAKRASVIRPDVQGGASAPRFRPDHGKTPVN